MAQNDIKVFISNRDSTCDECKESLGRKAWITLEQDKGALCLSCADIDHLAFLPSGNTALTRRSRKYSTLLAVVLKWSKSRRRYERQGLLVEEEALDRAEEECLADEDLRAVRRERAAIRRVEEDKKYLQQFAEKIREHYPGCPTGREGTIARHACMKYSGRVGRSASAKAFDPDMIELAVVAHIRHIETNYDQLLSQGYERWEARENVSLQVKDTLEKWRDLR